MEGKNGKGREGRRGVGFFFLCKVSSHFSAKMFDGKRCSDSDEYVSFSPVSQSSSSGDPVLPGRVASTPPPRPRRSDLPQLFSDRLFDITANYSASMSSLAPYGSWVHP